MTAELKHYTDLPQPMRDANNWCGGCPNYFPSGCSTQCEKVAISAGYDDQYQYVFFDPLLYMTWRLTK